MFEEFPILSRELGEFPECISLKLKPDAKPFVRSVPRSIPLAIRPKIQIELKTLKRLEIIEPLEENTQWVTPIACMPKGGDELRLFCDYAK